jgi:hypothetical protein
MTALRAFLSDNACAWPALFAVALMFAWAIWGAR